MANKIDDPLQAEHSVFVHAGPNLIAHYPAGTAAASPTQEYVYAQEIDSLVMLVRNSGNEKLTITRNQQWSVTALSDSANGNVLERYTYDHFGKRTILESNGTTVRATSSYNMPFGYTSREHDAETGLMYFRARYYDPHTAEFTSPDHLGHVDGMSLFRGYFVQRGIDFNGTFVRTWFDNYIDRIMRVPMKPDGKPRITGARTGKVCAIVLDDYWVEPGKNPKTFDGLLWPPSIDEAGFAVGGDPVPSRLYDGKNNEDILTFVKAHGCCTIYTVGHQGGDDKNPGGTVSYCTGDINKPFVCFPNKQLENGLMLAFEANGCTGCAINIVACGGITKEHRDTRQEIADNTGCTVCGSVGTLPLGPFGITAKDGIPQSVLDDGTLIGKLPWQHECTNPTFGPPTFWKGIDYEPMGGGILRFSLRSPRGTR